MFTTPFTQRPVSVKGVARPVSIDEKHALLEEGLGLPFTLPLPLEMTLPPVNSVFLQFQLVLDEVGHVDGLDAQGSQALKNEAQGISPSVDLVDQDLRFDVLPVLLEQGRQLCVGDLSIFLRLS